MNSNQQALYDRISVFSFDEGGEQLTFARRLTSENLWTPGFAERVIEEYKRFMFLAAASGHPVSPSDQVDQVWHLHLVYTRSYWDRFSGEVLKKPVHHGPTRGGQEEALKHRSWYQQTLKSYALFFGCTPPADIWPNPSIRFGDDLYFRRINTRRNWVIRKPRLVRPPKNVILLALLVLAFMVSTVGLKAQFGTETRPNTSSPYRTQIRPGGTNSTFSEEEFHLGKPLDATKPPAQGSPLFWLAFVAGVAIIVVLCSIFGSTCPACNQLRAMETTGAKSKDGQEEWRCKYCGFEEWKTESGGCGGCCG